MSGESLPPVVAIGMLAGMFMAMSLAAVTGWVMRMLLQERLQASSSWVNRVGAGSETGDGAGGFALERADSAAVPTSEPQVSAG